MWKRSTLREGSGPFALWAAPESVALLAAQVEIEEAPRRLQVRGSLIPVQCGAPDNLLALQVAHADTADLDRRLARKDLAREIRCCRGNCAAGARGGGPGHDPTQRYPPNVEAGARPRMGVPEGAQRP